MNNPAGPGPIVRWLERCLMAWVVLGTSALAQDIVLGQIGPFTGVPVPDARQISQGARAAVAHVNRSGGVAGRRIAWFELDDTLSPAVFAEQFDTAMQRKPVALISPWGSGAVQKMLGDKLLDRYDLVVMNAVPGSDAFRNPGHARLFHVRASDLQKLSKIVLHARALSMRKLAVLYQNNPVGAAGLEDVVREAARIGGIEVQGVAVASENLASGAREVVALGADGVLVLGAPPFAASSVAQLRKAGVGQTIFLAADMSPEFLIRTAGQEAARGVGIVQIYPDPNSKTGVREFQAAMKATFPELEAYTPAQFEGYVSTRVAVEGLRRIRGDITPGALAKALQTMGEIAVDGYRLNFGKGNAGSQFVNIAVIDAKGRLRY
ncbi:ABC-type branched-subunit amino acid transport system substrate-binding protein [Acidovorax soli]|uniref:ABC-type branched-subunit amino acid transport system substrate-binding protein n=1 Tax=Acidovorax soli TaxID=592050 RepID=A0A7X0PLC1_9BURK|nr:ABC transporter substrate-binding protein [Acidovorax soli]MBB6563511.1 ABC-type branched-subunit amino acid transport system substrate-binding protein [Acidovorax soli]